MEEIDYPCSVNGIDFAVGVQMDVSKILAELKQERDALEEAIATLERLALGRGKRRGRPPLWMVEAAKRKPADESKEPASRAAASGKTAVV